MNPLVPPFDALGLPAPLWLLFGLKVFGFWLHMIFMNLWFAGIPVALLLVNGRGSAGEAGSRLLRAMPVIIALGVNAGIVPLLFLQVIYPQFFYTTTVLQAWVWLSVVALVLIAYYAVYVYVFARKAERTDWWVNMAGWIAGLSFLAVGLVFASQMQLLTRATAWDALALPAVGGAVKGTHFVLTGSGVSRYLMMFGMALGTSAVYLALDANFFRRSETAAQDLKTHVLIIAAMGALIFAMGASAYRARIGGLAVVLGGFTWAAAGPAIVLLGTLLYYVRPGRAAAALLVMLQLASLLANAIARQLVQVREIARYFDMHAVPVHLQVSPIVLFLATLLAGIGVLVWLIVTYVRASARPTASEPAATARQAVYR